ncbi:MAG: hypothetical protein HXX81_00655, partial [Campylobacterales bacterium]|nr:hypothetical protein [Campylobacterales bacterium]
INNSVASLDQMTQESAKIANDTDIVSNEVLARAENAVEEALKKEFDGKENLLNKI